MVVVSDALKGPALMALAADALGYLLLARGDETIDARSLSNQVRAIIVVHVGLRKISHLSINNETRTSHGCVAVSRFVSVRWGCS